MNTTFAELKLKIIRCLSDEAETVEYQPLGGATYGADLLKDSVHAALDAVCSRLWKPETFEVDPEVDSWPLPDDLLDIESVYEKGLGLFIPRISMRVGSSLSSSIGNGWLMYPHGVITFVNDVSSSGCTVHYSARWAKPEDDGDVLDPPASTLTCLILFAASYCLLSDATSSASIDRFKTKVDSGQPTDNPAKEMSNFMLHRFEVEMQRLPMMEKGRVQ